MKMLAEQFRVISIDLKGFGQSDKKEGDFAGSTVAKEILLLLHSINVLTFHLAGHDWG